MSLNFPNQSRSYDATRRAVRFWGHDSAMEASFFVTEDALKRVQPDMRFDEPGLLGAFDANRALIYAAADARDRARQRFRRSRNGGAQKKVVKLNTQRNATKRASITPMNACSP